MRTPLLLAATVAGALWTCRAAHADEIRIFALSGNYSVLGHTNGVDGTFTLDATTGTVLIIAFSSVPPSDSSPLLDVSYVGLQTYDGSSTSPYALLAAQLATGGTPVGEYVYLPTNNLIDYAGGPVCSLAYSCPVTQNGSTYFARSYAAFTLPEPLNSGQFTLVSETNTAATPEPSSLALLSTALLSTFAVLRRRIGAQSQPHGAAPGRYALNNDCVY